VWRQLPGSREASVHLAEFPARASVEALVNEPLVDRWERLIAVRDEVNRALEAARQAKTIGTSLAASVSLRTGGETGSLLAQYRDDLPMLFIVSQVDLDDRGPADRVDISVDRANGERCARCWRVVPSISTRSETEGLCERCVRAIAAT
jgi:isoleucyl-tRNA synthetase